MISPETNPTANQRELSTSDKVSLINEIITEEVFAVDDSTDLEDIAIRIADNIDQARNRVRFLPNADVYFDYLEAIFGDISDAAGVENAAIGILETAQSLIDAGVEEGISGDASSYTSSEIGKLTAMLRQQISEEKARATASEDDAAEDETAPAPLPHDPEDDLDIFDDDDDFDDAADLDAVTPPETDSYNFARIDFAFEIARRRLERQAAEKAEQDKEKFTTHSQIKDALKKMYDAYQAHEDHDTHFAPLADALGVNDIADADTKEKIETALQEGIDFTLFDSLDSLGNELQKIENGTVDNPKNQLVSLKNSLLKLVTNLDSQLTVDSEASADFANVKADFLAAVKLLMQDYLLRYEAVAPAFAKPELQSIINALQAVIQGNLDPQDPAIRNILRPDSEGGANPFDTTSFITKGLSPDELREQTRVVQNLEQKVAIVLGDEDRANKYENLTFTQSLEEILQLVEVVDVDPSLILQVEQYWSQFLVGSDAAGGFDLASCFADTDLHAVAALQTKLTIQRNQIIQSFIDNELTPEQNQLAIEAVCVIDLCRNRLSVVLREVDVAKEEARKAAPAPATAAAGTPSASREIEPLPETSNQLVMNYRKTSLLGFFRKFMTEDVSGSEAVEAWSQVLKEKAARIEASDDVAEQMKDFMMALDGPVEFKLFNVTTADFASLTTLGPEAVEKRLSEDAVKVYDAFRSTEVYSKVVEKIGDLAYYLMYDQELEVLKKLKTISSNPDELINIFEGRNIDGLSKDAKDKLTAIRPAIDTIKSRLKFLLGEDSTAQDINDVLKLLIRYKTGGYSDKNKKFEFDWNLITKDSNELLVRDWTAKGDWSNGDMLMQFCAEIIYKYNADAKSIIESVDEAHSDEEPVEWLKSDERKDIPNLLMYIAQADTALRERRKKAAEFHLLRSKSAFKFKSSTKVGATIFANYVVYKVEKNNDTDAYASATALIEPDHRYVKVDDPSKTTSREVLPRIHERYNEIINFLAFRFAKTDGNGKGAIRRLIDSVKYKQRLELYDHFEGDHRNQIGRLGSAAVPLALDDFLTNYDRDNKQRESAADYAKLKQTIETLDSMIETVVNAWGNDQTESFESKSEGDLANAVNASFQTLGSDIAKAFAYTSSLPDRYKSELFEIFKALYKSYTIYILGQLKRNPYKFEDTEYDTKYEIITTAVRDYFIGNESFNASFEDRETGEDTDFVSVMEEFFDEAFPLLKQDNKYIANNLANQYVADIQEHNYEIQLRDEEKREEVKKKSLERRVERELRKVNPDVTEAEIEIAVRRELASKEKTRGQKLGSNTMKAVRFLFSGGDIPSIDLSRLSTLPKWPFGTKTNKDASSA